MRSRLVLLATVAMAVAALAFAIPRVLPRPTPPPAVHAPLPPKPASYLGAFEDGAPPAYQPLQGFGKTAGRPPDLVGYFSGWVQPFDLSFAKSVHAHGATLLVQIDPTYASVPAIAAGVYDSYLRSYAASVRGFGQPVILGFGHEMNAPWYPWGYRHVSPRIFVRAWRHIVTLFRQQGARNVTWLWTINAAGRTGVRPAAQWWPGPNYVTWIGIDGFYYRRSDTFRSIFANTIDHVRSFAPDKPVLLSETAVGPAAGQILKIANLFDGMAKYKTLGVVWFDISQHDGIYHQNWRIEDSGAAQPVFQLGVRDQMNPPPPLH
jgi:hypothetical protein